MNLYASDSGLSSEMENSSEMTRIEPSTEIKSEWTKKKEELKGHGSTEMQENTWARLRESSTHQGASHAT